MIMKASSQYYKIFVDLTDTTSSHPEHNYLFNRHKWSRYIINETFIFIRRLTIKLGFRVEKLKNSCAMKL